MKKFLPISLLIFLFACKTGSKSDLTSSKDFMLVDTMKVYAGNSSSDTAAAAAEPAALNTRPVALTRQPVRSSRPVRNPRPIAEPVYNTPAPVATAPVPVSTTPDPVVSAPSTGTTAADSGNSTATTPAPVKKKEGWSDAAKGATIGGANVAADICTAPAQPGCGLRGCARAPQRCRESAQCGQAPEL